MAKYDESSIERHAGLAGVRKKPTMYAGTMDENGLWTTFREPADNSVDRALAGQNDLVHLIVGDKPNSYWVLDHGPGIPVGLKVFEDERGRKEKLSTFFVVTGLIHGGGNFSGDVESRGTHGVGLKLTNALSVIFKTWTYRDKKWWYIEYSKGKLVKDVVQVKGPPKLPHGLKATHGTIVYFEPELALFSKGSKMDLQAAQEWSELTSYLVKGLTVKLTSGKGKTVTYKTKNGPVDFITKRLTECKAESLGKYFLYSSKEMDVALSFSTAEGDKNLFGYTNGLRNIGGGEHIDALTRAMYTSLKPYMGKVKKGDAPFKADDLLEGLIGLINYKIAAPKFNNQVKEKLLDDRVKPVATPQLEKAFADFWAKNKAFAKRVVANATALRAKTQDFLKDKKLIRNVNSAKKTILTKLAGIIGKVPAEKRELFLVEGDSASGTAKKARFKDFQAVFALRGKPLNVMEAAKDKVNNNAEIAQILAAINVDLSGKRHEVGYGKIIFLTDPDVDGKHINCLLLAFFWRYMPYLFKEGKIFLLRSPEFKAWHRGNIYFGMTKEAIYKQAKTDKLDVQHIKGWGEIDAVDMQPIAFDPDVRQLYRILPPNTAQGKKDFESLMGKDSAYRKVLLGVN